jgi:hypothetical protein
MAYFLDKNLAEMVRNEQGRKGRSGFNTGSSFGKTATAPKGRTSGARTNQYAADCNRCGVRVEKGAGSLKSENGAWVTTHLESC